MHCNLDYETRSLCDLTLAGAHAYARHPSTKVLCCAYSINDGPPGMWYAWGLHEMPDDLWEAMNNPACEMRAWNAQFERLITRHVLGVDIPLERWRCTAALSRARGAPGKLEKALEFFDMAPSLAAKRHGSQIMLKWCRPLPTGGWAEDPAEYGALCLYCIEDVRSEQALAAKLPPFTTQELADYMLAERVNDAGLPVDVPLALAAQAYGKEEKAELNAELVSLTGGTITSTSQHARIKTFLKARMDADTFARFFTKSTRKKSADGKTVMVLKESTDKASRADFLASEDAKEADPDVIEVIELVDDAGKASVAKYAKMAARAADTGRAQGAYIYAGAIQTKRFSSTGVQVHNLPRKTPDDVELEIHRVKTHGLNGKVMHLLASLLRPTIKAEPGRLLVWGDWSAVEARGMPWLAGHKPKLDLYRQGVDVYRVNAGSIFGTPYDEVPDDQRQIGKVAELSLQFGGARGALRAMARQYGISLDPGTSDLIVHKWRRANTWAAAFSQGLYTAFMKTVLGQDTSHGPIRYRQIKPLLPGTISIACDLPDGTTLYYNGVKGSVVTKHGGHTIDTWDTDVVFTKSMPGGFRIERVWHGLLAENVTQATCAALLRDCIARTDAALKRARLDAFVAGHTHDELLLDCADDIAPKAEKVLRREMVRVPKWLSGFPLDCEVKTGPRYVK